MTKKIEIITSDGEIIEVDASMTLAELIGSSYATAQDLAEALDPHVKGVSAAKIMDIINLITDDQKMIDAIVHIGTGDQAPQMRVTLERVHEAHLVSSNEANLNIDAVGPMVAAATEKMKDIVGEQIAKAVEQQPEPEAAEVTPLDLYDKALDFVVADRLCSPSFVQRKLKIGYNAACDILERMEIAGVVVKDTEANSDTWMMADKAQAPEPEAPKQDQATDEDAGPYADNEDDEASLRGQKARMRDAGPDENPFYGGTPDNVAWSNSYNAAGKHIEAVTSAGYDAGFGGQTRRGCEYDKGTVNHELWERGFIQGKDALSKMATDQTTPVDNEPKSENADDAYGSGRAAGLEGRPIDENPHTEGMTKHRLWNEGWEAGENQRLDAQDDGA